ncbi:MAG: hypothetical protein E7052_03475 [Lentisphaerae bacterium]|nr:hypothetical protein [Lentisphaerota bacterium]
MAGTVIFRFPAAVVGKKSTDLVEICGNKVPYNGEKITQAAFFGLFIADFCRFMGKIICNNLKQGIL